jgi:hypothetical protein
MIVPSMGQAGAKRGLELSCGKEEKKLGHR